MRRIFRKEVKLVKPVIIYVSVDDELGPERTAMDAINEYSGQIGEIKDLLMRSATRDGIEFGDSEEMTSDQIRKVPDADDYVPFGDDRAGWPLLWIDADNRAEKALTGVSPDRKCHCDQDEEWIRPMFDCDTFDECWLECAECDVRVSPKITMRDK